MGSPVCKPLTLPRSSRFESATSARFAYLLTFIESAWAAHRSSLRMSAQEPQVTRALVTELARIQRLTNKTELKTICLL